MKPFSMPRANIDNPASFARRVRYCGGLLDKARARFSLRTVCTFLLWATTAAIAEDSGVASTSHPVVAGTANEFFKGISSQEIRTAEGTKVTTVHGTDGQLLGIVITAQEKGGGGGGTSVTCGCSASGCASSCKTTIDPTRTVATCTGTCSSSERTPCGGCTFSQLIAAAVDCPRLRPKGRTTDAGVRYEQGRTPRLRPL